MKAIVVKAGETDISKFTEVVDIEDSLETYYDLIGCKYVEMPDRVIGHKRCTIVCDEEGLLKEHPIPSAIGRGYREMICGNLVICGPADDMGNLTGLTDAAIEAIQSSVEVVISVDGEVIPIIPIRLV